MTEIKILNTAWGEVKDRGRFRQTDEKTCGGGGEDREMVCMGLARSILYEHK